MPETHFLSNSNIFDQIDFVAMGFPLAPFLANLFMGFHEQNCIEKATIVKPIFYKRYIDVIFALFKFTFEKEKDKKLDFLDIN